MSVILVVGATGVLGSEICQQLAAAGRAVRAVVRATSDLVKVDRLIAVGVEIIQGDVRDRASLDEACKGVAAVICTVSSIPFSYQPGVNDLQTVDLGGVSNLIEAAKANAVSHFVYTSAPDISTLDCPTGTLDCPLNQAKQQVERRLKDSGLVYTILHPMAFMEIWLSPALGFDPVNAKATIYGTGQNPISPVAVRDVAKFAIASLDHPAAKNATLDIGGPEPLSPLDVVRLFEQASGRPFELQFVSDEILAAQQVAATEPMQESFAAMMRYIARGNSVDMSETPRTFDIQLVPVGDYVQRVLTPA